MHSTLKQKVGKFFPLEAVQGDLGVELEIEGIKLPRQAIGWAVKPENSLRGKGGRQVQPGEDAEDMPLEYVTTGAATLYDLSLRLTSLNKLLTRKDTSVNLTHRASTHFHVNMQNESLRTAFGFIQVYTIIEPILLRLCGPQRNGNLFCVPCLETADLPEFVTRCSTAILNNSYKYWPSENAHTNRGKYGALNTDPLNRFGSFEIRCFPNEIDPDVILKWGQWLLNIRRMASIWAREDYSDLVDHVLNQPSEFASTIFGGEPLWAACAPNNINELLGAGAELSYEIFKAGDPLFNFKEGKLKTTKKRLYDPTTGNSNYIMVVDDMSNFVEQGDHD